jgi:hypothetical protein
MVQDYHRVWGHHGHEAVKSLNHERQLGNLKEECPVCVFEFNFVEEVGSFHFTPETRINLFVYAEKSENQFAYKSIRYYNLRAPPQA